LPFTANLTLSRNRHYEEKEKYHFKLRISNKQSVKERANKITLCPCLQASNQRSAKEMGKPIVTRLLHVTDYQQTISEI
jgi:hypothetical protein